MNEYGIDESIGIEQFLFNLGIKNHPGFRYSLDIEGYENYTFGAKVLDFRSSIFDLSHELAHATQFGARYFNNRCDKDGFIFKFNNSITYNGFKATLRELETCAYQAHLIELSNIKFDRDKFFNFCSILLNNMYDVINIPLEMNHDGTFEDENKWRFNKINFFYKNRKNTTTLKRLISWLDRTYVTLTNEKYEI